MQTFDKPLKLNEVIKKTGLTRNEITQKINNNTLSLLDTFNVATIKSMKITFDPNKREKTRNERGIDFADAALVFAGATLDFPDERKDYGETRMISVGHLEKRMVIIVWTQRGDSRHIISMRKANEREQTRFGQRFEQN
jgi:uncharacterized protein